MKIKLNQTQADLITALLHNVILGDGSRYSDAAYDLMQSYPEIFGRECDEIPVVVKFPKDSSGARSIRVKPLAEKEAESVSTDAWPFKQFSPYGVR